MATHAHPRSAAGASDWGSLTLASSATLPAREVLARPASTTDGLSAGRARERLALVCHGTEPAL